MESPGALNRPTCPHYPRYQQAKWAISRFPAGRFSDSFITVRRRWRRGKPEQSQELTRTGRQRKPSGDQRNPVRGRSDGSDAEMLREQCGNIGRKRRRKPERKPRRGERRKRFEASGLIGSQCPARLPCCPRQCESGPPRSGKPKLLRERKTHRPRRPTRSSHALAGASGACRRNQAQVSFGTQEPKSGDMGAGSDAGPLLPSGAAIDPFWFNVSPNGTAELSIGGSVPSAKRVLTCSQDKLAPRAPVASPCLTACRRIFPICGSRQA